MEMALKRAEISDCPGFHEIQGKAFACLLEKYQNFDTNPAVENPDRIHQRFVQPITDYYLICMEEFPANILRICDFGETCRLSHLRSAGVSGKWQCLAGYGKGRWTVPQSAEWDAGNNGAARKALLSARKMGYRKIGEHHHIKDGWILLSMKSTNKNAARKGGVNLM